MSQSLTNVLIHLIFSTKSRQALILPEIEEDLYRYISTVGKTNDSFIHQIGGTLDHIHILLNLSKKIPLSKVVAEIKAHSSRWIKTINSNCHDFAWQSGYGAFSVSYSNFYDVVNYIQKQKEHHKKISFQDEYKILLKRCNIEFNEDYLWV